MPTKNMCLQQWEVWRLDKVSYKLSTFVTLARMLQGRENAGLFFTQVLYQEFKRQKFQCRDRCDRCHSGELTGWLNTIADGSIIEGMPGRSIVTDVEVLRGHSTFFNSQPSSSANWCRPALAASSIPPGERRQLVAQFLFSFILVFFFSSCRFEV